MGARYVILRDLNQVSGRGRAAAVRSAARAFAAGAMLDDVPDPAIDVAELSTREVADAARDPSVTGIAPSMHAKLIRPLASTEQPGTLRVENVTWGVAAVGAQRSPFTGAGIKVAVLDTGIDANHQAFNGVNLTERDYGGDGNGDTDGHGTHCAGTVFGRDVGGLRIGVATGVTEAFIGKVFRADGGGDTAMIARAITDAVEAGCQVISMSLGFDFAGFVDYLIAEQNLPNDLAAAIGLNAYRSNTRLFDALGAQIEARFRATRREVLLVAAAGNESKRQANALYELPVAPPADAEHFVSVGAAGLTGGAGSPLRVANFSNTGCNLCGPGVGVLSAKAGTTNDLVAYAGTSMATPHVAGVAALWLQKIAQANAPENFFQPAPRALGRLLGTAVLQPFEAGYDPFDVGTGLVQAPVA